MDCREGLCSPGARAPRPHPFPANTPSSASPWPTTPGVLSQKYDYRIIQAEEEQCRRSQVDRSRGIQAKLCQGLCGRPWCPWSSGLRWPASVARVCGRVAGVAWGWDRPGDVRRGSGGSQQLADGVDRGEGLGEVGEGLSADTFAVKPDFSQQKGQGVGTVGDDMDGRHYMATEIPTEMSYSDRYVV